MERSLLCPGNIMSVVDTDAWGWFFYFSIYPNVPMGVAWNGNNIGGATKRAVGIAMHVGKC